MGKFQSEYQLLKKRQRDFAKSVNTEDDIIYSYIGHCNLTDLVKTEIAAIWERDVKETEEKIQNEWVVNIQGMKTAYKKDRKVLGELNQQRAKKFEEIRQSARTVVANPVSAIDVSTDHEEEQHPTSTRRVNMNEEQNNLVISVSSGHTTGEEGSLIEVSETPEGRSSSVSETTNTATISTTIPANDTLPGIASTPIELIYEDDVETNTTITNAEDVIDSSAVLFDNTLEVEGLTTQDHINIRNIAGNFTTILPSQDNRPQHNYKFRKRSHLNC